MLVNTPTEILNCFGIPSNAGFKTVDIEPDY